jgi:hypothetical protein
MKHSDSDWVLCAEWHCPDLVFEVVYSEFRTKMSMQDYVLALTIGNKK